MVVLKINKDMQHRSLSPELAEGWRGRRRVRPIILTYVKI
jgi:hypothetical protein